MNSDEVTPREKEDLSQPMETPPSNNEGANKTGISRRTFVALAASGLSASSISANSLHLQAKSETTASGEHANARTPNAALPASHQVLSPAPNFMPDWTFAGSSVANWQTLGPATWKAENGVITATPASSGASLLILDKSFQDVQFFARVRSAGECNAGLLMRLQKSAEGISGIFVALHDGDMRTYRLTLDTEGREVRREPLPPSPSEMRFAFSAAQPEIPETPILKPITGNAPQPSATPGSMRGMKLPTPLPVIEPRTPGIWKERTA